MSRIYQRPENALKRAEELVAVNQQESALDLLHEVIMSKRSRATPIATLEPILLRFIELAVLLRKGKVAKEGLHQYKNISQNVTITAIELVIKKFIDLAESKVAEAQEKADKINLDNVDDLEAMETPESIILSTVSGDVSKDRTDREVVTPWLKFLWEAYRTALDILRNNSRLEILYQALASQGFKFCLKYTRKTEFRRLCEILRQHLTTSAKYAHQTHSINLSDPDTLQRHLDTRFEQLNAAAELELWQEGFRSIEDIHTLFIVSKKPPKASMLANYYEKLSRIFMVGENYLFHAAAYSKYFALYRMNKSLSDEEHEKMATVVLISALSIPIIAASKTSTTTAESEDNNKPRDVRLTNLLRVSKTPTRESLIKEALNKNVFSRIRPEVRELYNILEVDFHPLSICKKITPIIAKLSDQKDLTKYARPLHQVILTRLLQQLSQVYQSITIESIVNLASFPSLNSNISYDENSIEKFIMNGCRKGEFSMRVNHMAKTITFETDIFAGGRGSVSRRATPSDQMRSHLTTLAARLNVAINLINPNKLQEKREVQQETIRVALESMEEERRLAAERVILIEKRREIREYEAAKKVRDEEIKRQEDLRRQAELEKIRMEEEAKRREREKIEKLRADREREEALKLAERIAQAGKGKIDKEKLKEMDQQTLMQTQVDLLEQEKRDLANKMKSISKRLDHTERAFRRAETDKWEADYVEQKKIDKAYYNALKTAQLEASKTKHVEDIKIKQRVLRMVPDYEHYKAMLSVPRKAAHEASVAEVEALIADAKSKRIAEVRKRKQDELAKKMKEEEARRVFLENEKIRLAEGAKLAEERAAKEAARKAEEAERFKVQQERMRAVDEKMQQRELERSSAQRSDTTRSAPPSRVEEPVWRRPAPASVASASSSDSAAPILGKATGGWRERDAAKQAAGGAATSSGGVSGSAESRFGGDRRGDGFGNERSGSSGAGGRGFGGSDRGFPDRRDDRGPSSSFGGGNRDFGNRDSGFTNRTENEGRPSAGGGWRAREAEKTGSAPPASGAVGGSSISSSGKYVPPNRRGGAQ